MKPCCTKEASASIRHGREVATCDECGCLLLGYDNEIDFRRAVDALIVAKTEFDHVRQGPLWVIAKKRRA